MLFSVLVHQELSKLCSFMCPLVQRADNGIGKTTTPAPLDHHKDHSWHFNAIYTGIAAIAGIVCIVAVVLVTVCRINMRRQTVMRMNEYSSHRNRRRPRAGRNNRLPWQQSTPYCRPPDMQSYVMPHRSQASPNLAVNINLQISNVPNEPLDMDSAGLLMMVPPPYSEVEMDNLRDLPPREGTPPPPYSTIKNTPLTPVADEESVAESEMDTLLLDRPGRGLIENVPEDTPELVDQEPVTATVTSSTADVSDDTPQTSHTSCEEARSHPLA